MSHLHLKEIEQSRESSDYAILPLKIYAHQVESSTFFIAHHWHDEIEIIYIESGEFQIDINWTTYHATAGDIYFINSQEVHQITALTENSSHYAILFDPKIIRFEWHDPTNQLHITPLIRGKIKYPVHVNHASQYRQKVALELKEIIHYYQNQNSSWSLLVKASLLKVIGYLTDAQLMHRTSMTEYKDDERALVAKTIMTYIQQNYMQKITTPELAKVANLSVSYFSKLFKSMFGKTAVEYINEYRIEMACQLLTQTENKIIAIAFDVGFDNFSYFIRKFKDLKGMTPANYRKTVRFEQ